MDEKVQVQLGEFETLFKGNIFTVKQRQITYPNGSIQTHEYCQRFDSVTVLAFDEQNRLLLTREFRESKNKYVWFLPTGKIDDQEDPQTAIVREMREEIGLRPRTIRLLAKRSAGSSYFLWDTYIFVAKDLEPAPLEQEEYFPIEVVPTELAKAVEMAEGGEIENVYLAYNIIWFNYLLKTKKFSWG
ncbi:MAG: hypothetical protein COU31_03030 [Candidatus Magasanikbacteria bacterium CG10_big_fil_rev_8_21_14_0_10_40_10]|uniref:Nudix hydrolase domain-containing protein n=1 Tax=Candidatus Magasanikbacteria bacterium CG10_big_fil_rev_8_21_14_0_10_40_10 TaxID=1974648 RepID=A0A2M6W3N5_9BACT|nr:MAG: hypothetical protein COU31_03030 [Candidatus Magasanikbacteria bacterium CG10_big_fil_rev_8_21_14_0_10_40_10]